MREDRYAPVLLQSGQKGVSLIIALVALIGMSIAAIALIRAVDSINQISGNFAFRNAARHASDAGIETAFSALNTIVSGKADADDPNGCTNNCVYFATKPATADDSLVLPNRVDWSTLTPISVNGNYQVRYVIERLCTGSLPVRNIAGNCYTGASIDGGSKKVGGIVLSSTYEIFFRITVRVEGPRNTVSYVQALVSH
ncbi:Tfp pilus assembly protein PilX [Noviherbaspirillum humi]|uniref:Tfp pilus assembly protein PilX n=1 Tax=Noviherbaspirillum humi TaxID=1688639 RepID=A0A239KMJ4_9BURK|nr:hypothetical protein [Noviherbaspirillum humi]SNT19576.1 Tfp pilus assembly protein PilX [Noviherbaspirillum humi]